MARNIDAHEFLSAVELHAVQELLEAHERLAAQELLVEHLRPVEAHELLAALELLAAQELRGPRAPRRGGTSRGESHAPRGSRSTCRAGTFRV